MVKPIGFGEEEDDAMLPGPLPFTAEYIPEKKEWVLTTPEPVLLNDLYPGGRMTNRFLNPKAKVFKDKMKAAIAEECARLLPIALNGEPMNPWNSGADIMFRLDWYVKGSKTRKDIDGPIKLLCDSLNKTVIYRDDKQVKAFFPHMIEGSEQGGFIVVRIREFDQMKVDTIKGVFDV